jgi:predicted RecA/RadA family phage recombinase
MAQNHVQEGKIMTWTNATGTAVVSGEVIVVGALVCVALGAIANGAVGELAIAEVWNLPKEAPLVIAQGDVVYWDDTNNNIDKTNTNVLAGKAFAAAASADTTVKVKLNI